MARHTGRTMKRIRRLRDLALLLTVIVYSGAHMPTMGGLSRIGQSFKSGYDRAIVEHQHTQK